MKRKSMISPRIYPVLSTRIFSKKLILTNGEFMLDSVHNDTVEDVLVQKIRLGRTDLMVSRSGFGAIPIQRIPIEKSTALLKKAYDNGI